MRSAKGIISVFSIAVMFWGCSAKSELLSGAFEGSAYRFVRVDKNRIINTVSYPVLRMDGIPDLLIDEKTTSAGYPYSFSIYQDVPHVLLDSSTYQYSGAYDERARNFVVLYISPDRFSERQRDILFRFFRTEYPRVQSNLSLRQEYRSLNPVAVVYGTADDFNRRFVHNAGEALEVWTDGEVHYRPMDGSVQSTNLGEWVQMPGKRIILREPYEPFTRERLREYKDANGKTLEDYFELATE